MILFYCKCGQDYFYRNKTLILTKLSKYVDGQKRCYVIKNNLRLVQFLDIEEAHLKPNLQEQ